MGLLLSVLVSCVGAVELLSCLHYISDEWLLQQLRTQNRGALESALTEYQEEIRQSIENLDRQYAENAKNMMVKDGIEYVNGYRREDVDDELRHRFQTKLEEILERSQLHEHTTPHATTTANDEKIIVASSSKSSSSQFNDNDHENKNQPTIGNDDDEKLREKIHDDDVDGGDIDGTTVLAVKNERKIENDVDVDEKHSHKYNDDQQLKVNEVNDSEGATAISAPELISRTSRETSQCFEKTQSLDKLTFGEYEGHSSSNYDSDDHKSEHASHEDVRSRRLLRDDGTGRRRAIKKRNSADTEESKRKRKNSREEELKMFTSLEEAEFDSMKNNFNPIKYSSEPNLKNDGAIKRRHHHRHHMHLSESNILEIDEVDPVAVDDIGGDEVTHPWGDIVPEMRRDSGQWKHLQKSQSIDEEPELEADFESFVKSEKCAKMVQAGCETAVAEDVNSRASELQSESEYENNHNRRSREPSQSSRDDDHHSRRSHVSTPDSHESFKHAVVVVSPCTTLNITSHINDAKFEELTSRLQKIEQAIEQKISDWATAGDDSDEEFVHHRRHHGHHHHHHQHRWHRDSSYSSDEEPFYGELQGYHKRHLHHSHYDSTDQLEIDFRRVLEDNDIELAEDCLFLPDPPNRNNYVLHSDEEPIHGKRYYSTDSDSETTSSESDHSKRHKVKRHKRPKNIVKDSDTEFSDGKRRYKRKSKSKSSSKIVPRVSAYYDMLDELSDNKDDEIVHVPKIGNEKEFVMDSDEEPFYGEMTKRRNAISSEILTPSPDTESEYFMFQIPDSDEEPDRKPAEIIQSKQPIKMFKNQVVIPSLGFVQQQAYDSDEEPYFRESRIVYDIPEEELRSRCVVSIPLEMQLKMRKKLYDEYDIEVNENIDFDTTTNRNRFCTWDSDEEPNREEQLAYEERMRRSKSPSRSPACENQAFNLNQHFISMERENEEEERTTVQHRKRSKSPKSPTNVIDLGLIGTSKHREPATETSSGSDGESKRRKYKWEEDIESELGAYQRGELSSEFLAVNSRRDSTISGISTVTEATEADSSDTNYNDRTDGYDDSYEDEGSDHAWASETDTTQKSVIERRMAQDIFSNSDNENVDEIQDEEVPNGNYSGIEDEGATGGITSDDKFYSSDLIKVPQNSQRPSIDYDNFEVEDERKPTLRHSPKMYDLEKVVEAKDESDSQIGKRFDESFVKIFEQKLKEVAKEEEEETITTTKTKTKTKKIIKKIKKVKKSKSLDDSSKGNEPEKLEDTKDQKDVKFETRNFLVSEKEETKVLEETKKGSSKVDSKMFLEQEQSKPKPGPSLLKSKSLDYDMSTIPGKIIDDTHPREVQISEEMNEVFDESLNDDDLDPEEEILRGEEEPTSATGGTKRKSIPRPDPIYLLRESMYPFY